MASITKEQQATIRRLVRRANRRIERTMEGVKSKGQKAALEYFVKKATGKKKWSAATKGMSYEQAKLLIIKLNQFLEGSISTKKGWRAIKTANVSKANKTLIEMGYTLTDEELAEILMQIDTADKKEFYRAVNYVEATKRQEGDKWAGSRKEIKKALQEKASYQEALERVFRNREKK